MRYFFFSSNEPPALFADMVSDIDSVYYNMNHKRRGIAIIFNHEIFDIPSLKSRAGTKVDCENLSNTLSKLGFEVKVFQDLSYKEVIQTVDEGNMLIMLLSFKLCIFVTVVATSLFLKDCKCLSL